MDAASATALERDTVFRKLRSKPENKACPIHVLGGQPVSISVLWMLREAVRFCVPALVLFMEQMALMAVHQLRS